MTKLLQGLMNILLLYRPHNQTHKFYQLLQPYFVIIVAFGASYHMNVIQFSALTIFRFERKFVFIEFKNYM